jgi:L-fuconolactonase
MVTEAAGFSWNKETFYPFMDILLEAFGSRRLLFGSDWPVCLLAADYGRVKDIVSSFLDPFSALEKRDILGENAIKVYNL